MPRGSGRASTMPDAEQGLDLRGEQQPILAVRVCRVQYERTDAEAIAGQDQPSAALVPQGHGELAAQLFEHPLLVVFPEVRDHFRVAVGAKLMAPAFKLGTPLGVVEQFAVEDDGNAAILIADRLPAVGQADDAEAARGQGKPGRSR